MAKDCEDAVKYIQLAANQGHPMAQHLLAECFLVWTSSFDWLISRYSIQTGCGVDCDQSQAVVWWMKAAEGGDDNAQLALGQCYSVWHASMCCDNWLISFS